jgi:16S rRNA (cytosine967-C5)-methyltransferase
MYAGYALYILNLFDHLKANLNPIFLPRLLILDAFHPLNRLIRNPHNPQPADYLSTAFSLPNRLIADWLAEFGFEKTRHICFGSNRRPGLYIRPNPLKTTTEDLADKLQRADIGFDIVPDAPMIRINSGKAVTQLPGFAGRLFTIQDLTASHAVRMLALKPGSKILDLCAAPGVKTTQLAEITGDAAEIVATDINPDRLKLIEQQQC